MKVKMRFIALMLTFLMVLSQMSVAAFALDTVAPEESGQTVEKEAAAEDQPDAAIDTAAVAEMATELEAAVETEAEPAAEETAEVTEESAKADSAAEPVTNDEEKAEPAQAEEKKAEPAKAEEKKAEANEEAFDQSRTVDGVTVNVSAPKGVFPAGSKLSVSKVAVPSAVDTSDAEAAYAFDISIISEGKKIQPEGKAEVSFTTEEVADYDAEVYHMDGGAQKMSVSESGETATVTTSGFSVYAVVFSRKPDSTIKDTLKKELRPGDEVSLLEVFETLKLEDSANRDVVSYSYTGDSLELTKVGSKPVKPGDFIIKVTKDATVKEDAEIVTFTIKRSTGSTESGNVEFPLHVYIKKIVGYEVSFNLNGGKIGGEETIDPQYISNGEKATKPEKEPEMDYHVFDGWYNGDEEFNFETPITEDTELTAHWRHVHYWDFQKTDGNVEGKVYCKYDKCEYKDGLFIRLNADDVYYVGNAEASVDVDAGFPDKAYTVGNIVYYEGTITDEEDFKDEGIVSASTVKSTEGFYTARVEISENSNRPAPTQSLFKPFQVVSASPLAAKGLVFKDGKQLITDDDMRPEGTSAVVRYKHPTTGEYVSREELLNDGSIPAGEHVIDYVVLASVDNEPIVHGDVTVNIAAREFTLTFDLNGGSWDGATGVVYVTADEGTVFELPEPTRDGYTFDYWEGSKYYAGDQYTITEDHAFKAIWKANGKKADGKKADGKKSSGKKAVNTGDSNNIAGLLSLMIISAGALGAIGYRRRKEDQ